MRKLILLSVCSFFLLGEAHGAGGPFGLGFVVGSPTGISGNYFTSPDRSIDFAVAFDLDEDDFVFHADYLWRHPKSLPVDSESLGWYVGVGFSFRKFDEDPDPFDNDDDEYRFGPRFPVGIDYQLSTAPLEFFLELALVMNILPKTDADFNVGLGGRYYF